MFSKSDSAGKRAPLNRNTDADRLSCAKGAVAVCPGEASPPVGAHGEPPHEGLLDALWRRADEAQSDRK
jgi:hypothetical protein